MIAARAAQAGRELAARREAFGRAGLDVDLVWWSRGDPATDLERLEALGRWVVAYLSAGSRARMPSAFTCPPVDPGLGLEADWARFEAWITGIPFTVDFREDGALTRLSEDLEAGAVARNLAYVTHLLAAYGVPVATPAGMPQAVRHDHLVVCLRKSLFPRFPVCTSDGGCQEEAGRMTMV